MPSINVTLTSYDKREGNGNRGPWVLHLFKDSAGGSYQTFEAPISNKAYGLLDKPVVLTYEEKPARDPQYPPNKVIKGIEPDLSAPAVSEAPVASQTPPTVASSALIPVSSGADDRQIQIMRQSALERAIRASIGEIDLTYKKSTYDLAEEFLHYFQTGEYPGKVSQSEQEIIAGFNELAA